ncbi:unnamed protein product [Penicillium glandicola]
MSSDNENAGAHILAEENFTDRELFALLAEQTQVAVTDCEAVAAQMRADAQEIRTRAGSIGQVTEDHATAAQIDVLAALAEAQIRILHTSASIIGRHASSIPK